MERAEGKIGENLALRYLEKRGLRLLERNWRYGHLEVDLIMEDDLYLHIIEVRSRTAPYLISPAETVDWKKQRRLAKAAAAYIRRNNIGKEVLFDIVAITYEGKNYKLEYYQGAFIPLYV